MSEQTTTPAHLREQVAEEVRALMARRRLTGGRVGLAIGKSDMYVSRRLRGETAFDLDDLETIAGLLGVPVAALFPKSASEVQQVHTSAYALSARRPVGPYARSAHERPAGAARAPERPAGAPRPPDKAGSRRPNLIRHPPHSAGTADSSLAA